MKNEQLAGLQPANRVTAIDLLRGLAVIAMILVAYAGDWEHRFTILTHADWHGFALADMIFPAFLFCVGVAIPFSFARRVVQEGGDKTRLIRHVMWRSAALIALGIVLNALPNFDWAHVRLMGILQRIGLCYAVVGCACALLGRSDGKRFYLNAPLLASGALVILTGYAALLLNWDAPGCAGGCFDSVNSRPAVVDRAILGVAHMWPYGTTNGVVTFEPEGLLSTIGALFNMLLGVLTATIIHRYDRRQAHLLLAAAGVALLIAGFALDGYIPVVKKIWTPSFAILSGGFSLLAFVALALLEAIPISGWRLPILAYGGNATLAFVGITLIDTVTRLPLAARHQSLHDAAAFQLGHLIPEPRIASLTYSVALLFVLGLGLWQLYRRRIFFKL